MRLKKTIATFVLTAAAMVGVSAPAWASWATLTARDPGSHINLRVRPTIRSAAPQYGLMGDRVEILTCVYDTDTPGSDLNWCQVRFPRSGAIGWVRSDFMIFEDGGE
jgi:hypothetical protein